MAATKTSRAKTNHPTLLNRADGKTTRPVTANLTAIPNRPAPKTTQRTTEITAGKTLAFSSLDGLCANVIDSLIDRHGLRDVVALDFERTDAADFFGVYGSKERQNRSLTRHRLFENAFRKLIQIANEKRKLRFRRQAESVDLAIFEFRFELFSDDLTMLSVSKIPHLIIMARHSDIFVSSVVRPGFSACISCLNEQSWFENDRDQMPPPQLHQPPHPPQSLTKPAAVMTAMNLIEDIILDFSSISYEKVGRENEPDSTCHSGLAPESRVPIDLYQITPDGEVKVFIVEASKDCNCHLLRKLKN